MFRTRTWVPGGLGGRSRGAWAASPGPLWRLTGGSPGGGTGPNYKAHFSSWHPYYMSNFDVDFEVVFGSFWCRLGPLLGSLLGLRLALGCSKLVPKPSSKGLIFEKVALHEILCFTILLGGFCLHMGP